MAARAAAHAVLAVHVEIQGRLGRAERVHDVVERRVPSFSCVLACVCVRIGALLRMAGRRRVGSGGFDG